jgi:S-adenosylhomocysteine hydrolase
MDEQRAATLKNNADKLERLGEEIHEKGNSHNPEYWEASEIIRAAATRLRMDDGHDEVDEIHLSLNRSLQNIDHRVKEDAYNTIVAVLTGTTNGIACQGCDEVAQVDRDGYCWYCRELYDKKPEE